MRREQYNDLSLDKWEQRPAQKGYERKLGCLRII